MSQDVTQQNGTPALTMRAKRKSLFASAVGNVLEWYEWSVYAVFAPFIAAVVFNSDNPVSALLSTLAVFAVGFLMRPLGGIVFGRIADRRGRKFVLICTMLMMAGGSLVIGVMPTYDAVGVWASIILLGARMVQGFAHGGESATAYSYVSEIAPPNRRGMWGSVAFIAIFGGSVLAYTIGGAITSTLSESAVGQWGWRIPFLIGAVLALVALYLRRSMEESEVFDGQADAPERVKIPRRTIVRAVLLMICMTSGITAAHYTWTSYISTFAITQKGMDPDVAYWMLVIAQLIALVSLPFWGRLSDNIGRRPMLFTFAVLLFALQVPLTMMITDAGWTLLVSTTVALLIVSIPASVLSATLSESFPTALRTQSIGFAYSLSVAIFGGTAPYLNQLLINLEIGWAFGVYIMVLCVLTGLACVFMRETKGIRLEDA
ncbi:MFS transporter [Rhodococcus sp. BP-252]|uniref:MFS transporter n=1 Tax=unclassified Rhodococcus (in: high G+C Gram-positive bacteria) TaxID=192944 RepID=UPI001C9B3EF7|nr:MULTISPECIES: MFS transporter [unclassified Rhodococcus (in: high G+C Gram-positive bacteria)]MBY6414787.1 MFS transporter [Rhodococcus sp. BP-320]MBY6419691.1 MFS transporter [Rhodococcus sp. BP-321]MBY6424668.1 MFS transporter [Rhodococcus sp. BP-324]MBY6429665.1 MFS transporter [Rhodococcus sp. BP-323]MBY6434613.1 MFS transporter [Rhodococcus sp. BP-322]